MDIEQASRFEFEKWYKSLYPRVLTEAEFQLAIDAWKASRQQLAEQTSGEPVYQYRKAGIETWSECSKGWYEDFQGNPVFETRILNTQNQSVEVLLEALRKIANAPLIKGTSIQAIATDALATYKPTEG
jgi:hypothetical protein